MIFVNYIFYLYFATAAQLAEKWLIFAAHVLVSPLTSAGGMAVNPRSPGDFPSLEDQRPPSAPSLKTQPQHPPRRPAGDGSGTSLT
jgi:hypothetical protein